MSRAAAALASRAGAVVPKIPAVTIAPSASSSTPSAASSGRPASRTRPSRSARNAALCRRAWSATTGSVAPSSPDALIHAQPRKPGSVGMPLGGTEIRIADADERGVGDVQLRGPSVIAGYWSDDRGTSESIDEDGWLSTGDVGYLDDDGYLFLVDRKKELIIRGGYNVYPREVEEALYAHPAVLEAAVVGVPDATLGEEVAALVVLRRDAAATPDELTAWTRERVAAYKYPRRIAFVDELPKGPTGKVLKSGLIARVRR